jgi:hypothetical protein
VKRSDRQHGEEGVVVPWTHCLGCGKCGPYRVDAPAASSAPPSRSEAEARPPATVEAPEVDPVGSLSDGLATLPREQRPCCPDAGDWRCHGQSPGTCLCYACGRAERWSQRERMKEVRRFFKAAPMRAERKQAVRKELARVLLTLRGRARAEKERAERLEARVGALEAEAERSERLRARLVREVEKLEALSAGQANNLSLGVAELTAAQNQRDAALARVAALERELDDALHTYRCVEETEAYREVQQRAEAAEKEVRLLKRERDDALMQASAAAERASRYEESRGAAEDRVEELEEELAALRAKGAGEGES